MATRASRFAHHRLVVGDDPLVVAELAPVLDLALGRRDAVPDLHGVEKRLSVVVRQGPDLAPGRVAFGSVEHRRQDRVTRGRVSIPSKAVLLAPHTRAKLMSSRHIRCRRSTPATSCAGELASRTRDFKQGTTKKNLPRQPESRLQSARVCMHHKRYHVRTVRSVLCMHLYRGSLL